MRLTSQLPGCEQVWSAHDPASLFTQQLPASIIVNSHPAAKGATETGSILQEQPSNAHNKLMAPAAKTSTVYNGSTPTQQPAAVIKSDHPATMTSGPIKTSAPRQPPVGNKKSPAPTARGGPPVTAPPSKQQPASATVAPTKKVLRALSQEYCHFEAYARVGLFCVSFVQQLHAERPL